jgi:hypothetical protein
MASDKNEENFENLLTIMVRKNICHFYDKKFTTIGKFSNHNNKTALPQLLRIFEVV